MDEPEHDVQRAYEYEVLQTLLDWQGVPPLEGQRSIPNLQPNAP